jgi:Asp/Glu/hydantoin racemase
MQEHWTNTATIESTSSNTPVSSSVNAIIVAPHSDPAVKEARFTITLIYQPLQEDE